jgi:hypothetical protein
MQAEMRSFCFTAFGLRSSVAKRLALFFASQAGGDKTKASEQSNSYASQASRRGAKAGRQSCMLASLHLPPCFCFFATRFATFGMQFGDKTKQGERSKKSKPEAAALI